MSPVVVVGAGISGVACARVLDDAGVPVRLLDRGREPGGRMSSRPLPGMADRPVDLGASYFTVSDEGFGAVVERWRTAGLARPWTDTFLSLDAADGSRETKSGPVRWGATQGLRSLVIDLAAGLDVQRREVTSVAELPASSAVVLAMPDPQARRLLPDGHAALAQLTREFEPTLALAAQFAERTWDLDGAFVNGDHAVAWIADDGRRRGDEAPVLVAHSTPEFAAGHLDDPVAAGPALVASLRAVLDLPEPTATHVHRWSLAKPTGEREDPYLLLTDPDVLGVCGDGWGPTSKVETAWLSGTALGRALVERLG